MTDPMELLRARLTAPGVHNADDTAAIRAAIERIEELERLCEAGSIAEDMARMELARLTEGGTVEWGVQYEWLVRDKWIQQIADGFDADVAAWRAKVRIETPDRYRNVKVVTRRRYVTDWQPVEANDD